MTGTEIRAIETAASPAESTLRERAQWSTPRVIASELSSAKQHVNHGADGSSPSYGPYGS
jgi:hypothetical protein